MENKQQGGLQHRVPLHMVSEVPPLWTRSSYCESVGHISEATVRRYIEEQKGQ